MRKILACLFVVAAVTSIAAQEVRQTELPLTAVALFSSGVGFFEHVGTVRGATAISLAFDRAAVNDVLKSLVIHDPASSVPTVSYPSEDTLEKTLKGLRIDLSGDPGLGDLLNSLRGAEIRLTAPNEVVGRIIGVERRGDSKTGGKKDYLTVSVNGEIRVFELDEISGISFTDPRVSDDLKRALDLILSSRNAESRSLLLNLSGSGTRSVSLGYVTPASVWKATYRLDLAGNEPFLQGWAIVDNTGEMDWVNVRLSLIAGKPVSFIQNLYEPYYLERPEIPLSIAGSADARVYDQGYGAAPVFELSSNENAPAPRATAKAMIRGEFAEQELAAGGVSVETTTGKTAGDFFAFTVAQPVTLARRQSAMLPLVQGAVTAEKMSVYSEGSPHPMLCARLTNTTGMKLPAGPVTVYDDGLYAGDALVEFFPENERRLIAFAEDSAVNGAVTSNSSWATTTVTAAKGVMTFVRKRVFAKTYTFRNADARARKLVVEHAILPNAGLVLPAKFDERTETVYRFVLDLPAMGTASLTVKEERPERETVNLVRLDANAFLRYASSGEIPEKVRAALAKAAEFKRVAGAAADFAQEIDARQNAKIAEQDRIRKNLEAAGNDSPQGKEYLKKLVALDVEIEGLSDNRLKAQNAARDAESAYETFLSSLVLE